METTSKFMIICIIDMETSQFQISNFTNKTVQVLTTSS
jgi:hypothetical protein